MVIIKRIIPPLVVFVFMFIVVSSVHAINVDQDVTLEVSGPGGTHNVTLQAGSSFTSITLTNGSLSIEVGAGQSVTLSLGTESRKFSNDQDVETTCGANSSSIILAGGKTYAITIGNTCVTGGGGGAPGPAYTPPSSGGTSNGSTSSTVDIATTTTTTTETTEEATTTETTEEQTSTPNTSIFLTELELGMENDDVLKLQLLLASDPELYPEGLVTGYYGQLTAAAVRRFQAKYGISQVGRVGPQTIAKLNEVFGNVMQTPAPEVASPNAAFLRELETGMTGDDINALQAFLASDPELYPEGLVTGYYGQLTAAAVRRFQAKYGISQVGRVGPQTIAKLNEVLQ